jgi:glycogen phosphorylase
VSQTVQTGEATYVLTLEEIANLAMEGGKPAETLMNVVALIAKRFRTDRLLRVFVGARPGKFGSGRNH